MPSRLSIVAAVAATLIMIPALASAQGPVGAGPGPAPGPAGPGAGGGRGPGPAAAGPRVGGPGPGNVGRNVTVNRNVYINRGGPVGGRWHSVAIRAHPTFIGEPGLSVIALFGAIHQHPPEAAFWARVQARAG